MFISNVFGSQDAMTIERKSKLFAQLEKHDFITANNNCIVNRDN